MFLAFWQGKRVRSIIVPVWGSLLCEYPNNAAQNDKMVGLGRLELPTSPLSGVRSNQLSYRPVLVLPDEVICVST